MPLTPDQLLRSVEHIQFEVDRLVFCWDVEKRLECTDFDIPGHDVCAALREATLLHCRVLLAFLFRPLVKYPRGDDLFASCFFDSPDDWQPVMPDWLESDYQRLHKLLAHLTYERTRIFDQGRRGWKIDRLVDLALREWNHFAGAVAERWRGSFKPASVSIPQASGQQ